MSVETDNKAVLGLTQVECASLSKVVSYLVGAEEKHWEENDYPYDHIIAHIRRLRSALSRTDNSGANPLINGFPASGWADAIANRVSDEGHGKVEYPLSSAILRYVLATLLAANPAECEQLVGTGIIEADYFDGWG